MCVNLLRKSRSSRKFCHRLSPSVYQVARHSAPPGSIPTASRTSPASSATVEALPKNNHGKVPKTALRQGLADPG
jgi:hypothetical protein